jgi:hypothetical protein
VTCFDGGDAAFQETLYDALRNRVEAARARKTMMEMALDTATTGGGKGFGHLGRYDGRGKGFRNRNRSPVRRHRRQHPPC